MAIQKSFVIKNGIEVNSNLIFGDATTDRVGIGTTQPTNTLQVVGGIGATSINITGVGTIPTLSGTTLNYSTGSISSLSGTNLNYSTGNIVTGVITSLSGSTLNYSGIATAGSYRVGATEVISSARELKNIVSLDSVTTATIESAIANAPNTFTDLSVTGISTLGTVEIASGIVTATSGIVTYYGDGKFLQNILSGVGVATAGGTVGTGATIIDFRGPGISTVTVSSGIATVNIVGGGGAVSIGVTAPIDPANGDLWYSPDYGRTFVWYDEVALGIGSTAVWVDAAPFNINMSQFESLELNNLTVLDHTDLNTLDVSGISTFTNTAGSVKIGIGTTALLVEGNARITGILTVGTGSITFDGSNNQITIGNGLTINSSGISATNADAASTMMNFNSTNSDITNLTGTAGTITTLNSTNGTITTLNSTNGNITNLTGTAGTITTFNSTNGTITNLNSTNGTITNLTGTAGTITTLNSTNGTITNLAGTGVNVSGVVTATTFVGSGSSLTSLNASNISSGTVPTARLASGTANSTTYLRGDQTWVTIATGIAINDDISTNATRYLTFTNATSGSILTQNVASTRLTFNPSNGTLSATTFSGSGASLTSLNASNISSGTVPTARLASGTANSSTFLRGDQTWATVTSGITITNDTSTNATRYLTFTSATSGSISGENVSSSKLTFNPSTGVLTVVNLNSTSDINLKTNIHTVENALDTVSQLRGVSFDWKETGKGSYGVIAQEIEELLPELVGTGETKSVNYNGLVGVLIEAIKELKSEIEDLKNSK